MSEFDKMVQELGQSSIFENLSPPLQMAILIASLALVPAALAGLTCFTRIVIVLSFVRRALSTQEIPPNSVMLGLALFLTLFVMGPTWEDVHRRAISPYVEKKITGVQAFYVGMEVHKQFMLRQTRRNDLALFLHMADVKSINEPSETPLRVLIPAFIISELKTAFLMGFCIFVPFLLIDMVVSTILMALGMMMLPPVVISTPFKILLFVLADGWHLVSLTLNSSFG